MTTLIAAYNSEGCIGRCDAKCYNAQSDHCECICGGVNHGAGLNKATENTTELAQEWMAAYRQLKGDESLAFEVLPKPIQLELL